jgi:hypothetical protein
MEQYLLRRKSKITQLEKKVLLDSGLVQWQNAPLNNLAFEQCEFFLQMWFLPYGSDFAHFLELCSTQQWLTIYQKPRLFASSL